MDEAPSTSETVADAAVERRLTSFLGGFARLGALATAALGLLVLAGWVFGVPVLQTIHPGLISMKLNTACCFVAAGIALWCLLPVRVGRVRGLTGLVLAVLVAAVSGLSFLQYLLGLDLGIDELLGPDLTAAAVTVHPGRMAPSAAVGFLLIAVALLLLGRAGSRRRSGHLWPAVAVHLLATMALIGYATGVRALYKVGPYSSIALHTAAGLWLLSLSLVTARPWVGFVAVATRSTDGGYLLRRLLPSIPVALLFLGLLCVTGVELRWWSERFALALLVLASSVVAAALVIWQGFALHRVDLRRRHVEAEIAALNLGLERGVLDRTRELENALQQVKRLQGLVPVCAWCKRMRDDNDYWHSVEVYLSERTEAQFSHGICPECFAKETASWGREALPPGPPAGEGAAE